MHMLASLWSVSWISFMMRTFHDNGWSSSITLSAWRSSLLLNNIMGRRGGRVMSTWWLISCTISLRSILRIVSIRSVSLVMFVWRGVLSMRYPLAVVIGFRLISNNALLTLPSHIHLTLPLSKSLYEMTPHQNTSIPSNSPTSS